MAPSNRVASGAGVTLLILDPIAAMVISAIAVEEYTAGGAAKAMSAARRSAPLLPPFHAARLVKALPAMTSL